MRFFIPYKLHKVAAGLAGIAASTIVLSATVNRNTGVAPLHVQVDTTATASSSTTRPFHEIEYRTVCSDGAMGTWSEGSKPGTVSKALHIGPIAGFVLENAGTYTLTTTAYINGVPSIPVTNVIVVTAADTHFTTTPVVFTAGLSAAATSGTLLANWTGGTGASPVTFSNGDQRFVTLTNGATTATWTGGLSGSATSTAAAASTVCLSSTGSATGAPSGAYIVTGSDWGVALAYIATGTTTRRLLLNRGETFTAAGTQKVLAALSATPILCGAYGSGAKPKVSPPTSEPATGQWFSLSSSTTAAMIDIRIMDWAIDAGARVDDKLVGIGAGGGVDQVCFLRVDFVGTQIGISLSENTLAANNTVADASLHTPQNTAWAGHHIWDQWALVDCTVTGASRVNTVSSLLPYGLYFGCIERLFLSGCLIDVNSIDTAAQRASHVLRINYSYKSVIGNNTLKRPGNTRLCLKLCSSTYGNRQIQNVNVNTTAVTFSSAPSAATSGTLNATWGGATGTYTVKFSNAEERQVLLTNGSATTGTWNKALGTVTTAATVYPLNTPYLMASDPSNNGGGMTKYVHIADNDFGSNTDTSTLMVAISPPANDGDGRGQQIIFERNLMHAGAQTQILIQVAWQKVTIRNNLFDFRGGLYGEGIRIVREWTAPDPNTAVAPAAGPVPDDIAIYNNSFSAPTVFSISSFWAINRYDASSTNLVAKNNLAYAPLDAGYHRMIFEQLVGGGTPDTFVQSNNSSDAQVLSTSPLWATTPPGAIAEWLLQSGSYGKNAGANVPVWSDFFGTVRAPGSMDMGATEQ